MSAHDLHRRRARAVQIDDRVAAHPVQIFAGVLFHVHPDDAHHPLPSLADVEMTSGAQGGAEVTLRATLRSINSSPL